MKIAVCVKRVPDTEARIKVGGDGKSIEEGGVLQGLATSTDDPVDVAIRDEETSRLWQAIASLPEEQRLIVALHVYGEMTFKEIAANEGISENTAQSRCRYAIEKLKRQCRGGGA